MSFLQSDLKSARGSAAGERLGASIRLPLCSSFSRRQWTCSFLAVAQNNIEGLLFGEVSVGKNYCVIPSMLQSAFPSWPRIRRFTLRLFTKCLVRTEIRLLGICLISLPIC